MENKIEEIEEIKISELPKSSSWTPSDSLYNYKGFWFFEHMLKSIILFQKNFIPHPTDIFLCTPPKCGTTWLKALSFAIFTRNRYMSGDSEYSSGSPLLSKSPHDLVPYIEPFLSKGKTRDPNFPLIQTHLPFSLLPESVKNSTTKIIYICRDPKDVLISTYFFVSGCYDVLPFEEVYEMFCNGVIYNGPYWDHVLEYWKAYLEFPERVLFLKYEDLKSNTCFYVKKTADFMGCSFSIEEENNGAVEKIIQLCSLDNLSKLDVNKNTQGDDVRIYSNSSFF